MTVRLLVTDFALKNPYYANAAVAIYTIDQNLEPTSTLATLYSAPIGGTLLSNPQVLNSQGQFEQPVYVGVPVSVAVVPEGADEETFGPISLVPRWRGTWQTGTLYYIGERFRHPTNGTTYTVIVSHTSGVLATDIANTRVEAEINLLAAHDLVFDFGDDEPVVDQIYSIAITRNIVIPNNFAGSSTQPPLANPTAPAVFVISQRSPAGSTTQIGTATIAVDGTITWAFDTPGSPLSVPANSRILCEPPDPADATLQGVVLTIAATREN